VFDPRNWARAEQLDARLDDRPQRCAEVVAAGPVPGVALPRPNEGRIAKSGRHRQPARRHGRRARRRSRNGALALAALSLAAFAYVTTESLPIGLLVPMSKGLRAEEPAIGLLVTTYGAVVVVASVPLTLLTRRLPRRLVLCCVLAVFVAASVSSAATSTYGALLGARLVTALS